jgi:hypothetical protein
MKCVERESKREIKCVKRERERYSEKRPQRKSEKRPLKYRK